MPRTPKYTVVYAPEVVDHLLGIERKYHRLIQSEISEQLEHSPLDLARNKKPLKDLPGPFGATWELRFGPDNRFRVFYDVEEERLVLVLAIGVKKGSRLFFAGEEFQP
jgi:mRNA-degrading endonuclease RelE of RelBE toxin-antitoxin system